MARKKTKATKATPKKKRTASDWAPRFLAALARTSNIRASCAEAKVDRSNVYKRRDRDEQFAAAMRDALDDATDDLELEARRRAHDGLVRLKFHQGSPVMVPLIRQGEPVLDAAGDPVMVPYVEHEYSDTLLIFLLKAHRPDKYRETVAHRHAGADGESPVAITFIEVNVGDDGRRQRTPPRISHQPPAPPAGADRDPARRVEGPVL